MPSHCSTRRCYGIAVIQSTREHLKTGFYSKPTGETGIYWLLVFIFCHNRRQPQNLDETHLVAFPEYLAGRHNVAPSAPRTALNAPL
ncbi:phage integrase N-terminal SAM-like domain-containing protein [Porticoccus sp.]